MIERWEGLEVLARGANRVCVRDPVDPTKCLKFELSGDERTKAGLRARLRRWIGRRFPSRGDNGVELRAWRRLEEQELRRRGGSYRGGAIEDYFAACHEIVDTRWGKALRCECVLLEDGTPAPSLYRVLFGELFHLPRDEAALCSAVDEFERFLLDRGIPLFDLNAGNFVVVPTDGGVRLVCVDAKSTVSGKEIVPVSRWIPWLRRRKVRRRAERLRQRIRSGIW